MPMSVSTVMVRGLSAIALAVVITTQAITAQEYRERYRQREKRKAQSEDLSNKRAKKG